MIYVGVEKRNGLLPKAVKNASIEEEKEDTMEEKSKCNSVKCNRKAKLFGYFGTIKMMYCREHKTTFYDFRRLVKKALSYQDKRVYF